VVAKPWKFYIPVPQVRYCLVRYSSPMPARRTTTPLNAEVLNENEQLTEKIEGETQDEEDEEVSPSILT
jgi:hypothetical protein